ncbi:MAG: acyl-CoA dehydrogenase family protein [Defluviicoccus sp.]|nr:acyl-CoA dehydrogenase family protein [Defluviicoccus sp.]MDE0383378.1 acyl-CoA dehydrogenase family protein [Defluviicoccus sp.]
MADRSFLDWPFFDDSHRKLAAEVEDWAGDAVAPLEHEEPRGDAALDALCRRLVGLLAEGGWLRYCVPGSHGGATDALDVRSLCLIRELLAYRSGLADFCFVMQGLGTGAISLFGSEALKSRYLPGTASGERIAAFALSEPASGSDVAAMTTTARADGADYVLDGEKTLISNAGIAAQYVVFARTGEGEGAKGLSAFVVDADAPGLDVPERFPVIAPHPLGSVRFSACRVPATQMLASPGDGFKVAMASLDVFRSTVAAAALGFARRALDETLARSRGRIAFGKPIADTQLIQEKIADMAVKIDAAALLTYRSAWTKDRFRGRVTREAAIAKLYATEAAQEVVDQAVQVFGGQGVIVGNAVERLYREIRALRIYEGTSEIQKLIVAGQTLAGN